jgi:hypothetical protein
VKHLTIVVASVFKLSFKPPEHGWLPVRLISGAIQIDFLASGVPNDPIQELIDALGVALQNGAASVWWHLEPGGYYFDFSPCQKGVQLRVSLEPGNDLTGPKRELLNVVGTHKEVLLPIWRALRTFESFNAQEPHWPTVQFSQLHKLGEVLRAM